MKHEEVKTELELYTRLDDTQVRVLKKKRNTCVFYHTDSVHFVTEGTTTNVKYNDILKISYSEDIGKLTFWGYGHEIIYAVWGVEL